jgi:tetratricopeptide (TPR) repeat protein
MELTRSRHRQWQTFGMIARLFLCAGLLVTVVRGAAPDSGQEEFRRLVRLPTISMTFGFSFTAREGLSLMDDTTDPETDLATVRNDLKGDASDAERYLNLQQLLRRARDDAGASNACLKSVALFRQRLGAQPDDVTALTGLGEALTAVAEEAEAESVLRKAVRIAPRDPKAWIALGVLLEKRSLFLLVWKAQSLAAASGGDRKEVSPFEFKPVPGDLAEGKRLLDEATECFNRAVEVAPKDARWYVRRAAHKSQRSLLSALIRHHRGETTGRFNAGKAVFAAEMLPDLDEAARLDPSNYVAVGTAAMIELFLPLVEVDGRPQADGSPSLEKLSDEARRRVSRAMSRLEELGGKSDSRVAAGALESLAVLQTMLEADPV